MHQPGYLNLDETKLELPWVRLHSTKAYFDMPWMLERHPHIRCSINFVPILLEQIQLYLDGMRDVFFEMTAKPTSTLTTEEKRLALSKFFSCNFDTCIASRPRYLELHANAQEPDAVHRLETQDFRDLMVLFNLSWFGYGTRVEYPLIEALESKGRDFSEDDKRKVLDLQIAAMHRLFPMYRRLIRAEQIEISTTPYHHPILPLIIDTDAMQRCMPNAPRPVRFQSPDDARRQVSLAVESHHKVFQEPPCGMWPAEGSVSPEALALLHEYGLRWAVTDEAILWRSLGMNAKDRGDLYHPYKVNEIDTTLFFRDRDLSDAMGFRYARMDTQDGVQSFINQVLNVSSFQVPDSPLVVVALDGENPWEYYRNDGRDFLEALYNCLEEHDQITTTRLCDTLDAHRSLDTLATGSWIDGDFGVWIGGATENKAWGLLKRASDALESKVDQLAPHANQAARRMLLRAQSSDWFWWYGDRFESADDADFDALFRGLLRGVYMTIDLPVPEDVDIPLVGTVDQNEIKPPLALISPDFTQSQTPLISWADAGQCTNRTGSMAITSHLFGTVFFGFDQQRLYFRILSTLVDGDSCPDATLTLFANHTESNTLEIKPKATCADGEATSFARWTNEAVEGYINLATFDLEPGAHARFKFNIDVKGKGVEGVPLNGDIASTIPETQFASRHWTA